MFLNLCMLHNVVYFHSSLTRSFNESNFHREPKFTLTVFSLVLYLTKLPPFTIKFYYPIYREVILDTIFRAISFVFYDQKSPSQHTKSNWPVECTKNYQDHVLYLFFLQMEMWKLVIDFRNYYLILFLSLQLCTLFPKSFSVPHFQFPQLNSPNINLPQKLHLPTLFAAARSLELKHGTPKLPCIPSQTTTGGLPYGLIKSILSRVIFAHTAFGEHTNFATFRLLAPDDEPVKLEKWILVMSTREG